MSQPAEIRQAFASAVSQITGVLEAFDHEPEVLPANMDEGAAVTMIIAKVVPEIVETGGAVQIDWNWAVYVYVLLSDYAAAQDQMTELLPPLLLITMLDPDLGGTCDQAWVTDAGGEPFPEQAEGGFMTLVKQLNLRARADLAP